MNRIVFKVLAIALGLLVANAASARDDRQQFPVKDVFERTDVKEKLGDEVRFYFGDQKHPAVAKRHGEFQSNKKTNAFNKTDKGACEWALFSALLAMRDRALKEGGNAVINIRSNYKSELFTSATEYECGAGKLMAGVTIIGDVVTLK